MAAEPAETAVCMTPVGTVRNKVAEPKHEGWSEVVSELVLRPELAEMLDGIEEFSHLDVLFWLDRLPEHDFKKIHPKDRPDVPLVGLFATRSQFRPNPIAVTTVKLLLRSGNVLTVQGLDALNGTPVLDIKPHIPLYLPQGEIMVPDWVSRIPRY